MDNIYLSVDIRILFVKVFLNEKELDEKIYPHLILPIDAILDDNYFVNSQGIIGERNSYYKHCGSKNFLEKVLIGDYIFGRWSPIKS